MEKETNTNQEKKKQQGRKKKGTNEKKTMRNSRFSDPTCRLTSFFLDSAILFVSPPPLPLVRGVGCHDRVGQKFQAFVSGCPISICIPGDRDEVLHRSSSTKDGTLCPVSYSSALDHLRWSRDGMVKHDHWIWLKDSIGGRCWCFGIWCQRKCRSTRRNGGVGRGLSTMARVDFSVVNGSCC